MESKYQRIYKEWKFNGIVNFPHKVTDNIWNVVWDRLLNSDYTHIKIDWNGCGYIDEWSAYYTIKRNLKPYKSKLRITKRGTDLYVIKAGCTPV